MTLPRITQAMIDLYDRYTHVTLDRRDLMARLGQLAGSSAAAAAILPLIEAQPAAAAIIAENDKRLSTQTVEWSGGNVHNLSGYLVRPVAASSRLGAVMVVHENRGLTPHIRDVARRLALEGFIVLAPDFLSPAGGTPSDEDKARTMIAALGQDATVADGVATLEYLAAIPGANSRVGAVGFCWGGGMVNAVAVAAGRRLRAGVAYYGPTPPSEMVANIKAHMLLHYAGLDERIDAGIPAYEHALQAAKVPYEKFVYPGVNHAFNNDTAVGRYDKAASDLAWGRTVAFLHKAIG